ncbi:ribonuclease H [Puerhibacterium sp. TATVAM-FAB25]|uniref:ribonuclease H family protein n=1 Tax=Puerhibacterium sp. TATVAM-FAB25 TaxID=3093699 RepID=UPI00397DE35F
MIIVSTDGSCLRNPGGAIGWAWVAHDGGRFDSGGAASGTNQVAELTAVLRAVEAHPGAEPLLIEADSQYAIRCASEWIEGWRRKGWRTASGSPVKNLELVRAIDRAITDREGPVRFRWVRGHVGNPFNERADELAGLAARDWAAGRGEIGSVLIADLPADGDTAAGRPRADEPVAAGAERRRAGAREAAPQWELGTLFD